MFSKGYAHFFIKLNSNLNLHKAFIKTIDHIFYSCEFKSLFKMLQNIKL